MIGCGDAVGESKVNPKQSIAASLSEINLSAILN